MRNKYTTSAISLIITITFFFSFTTRAQENQGLPPDWEFQSTSSNPHGIIVMLEANPRINTTSLEPGDYIGAFYTDDDGELRCGGADFWLGDENIIFPVFGNDNETPEKDGFSFGEQMHFKAFSWVTQKAYDIDIIAWDTEYLTTDLWYPLGLSAMIDVVSYIEFDAYITATPNPVCIGNSVSFTANIFAGTTGNYTYLWTSEPEGFLSTIQNPTHTPTVPTTYHLVVSDGVLSSNHQLSIPLHEPPTIDAGADITICSTGCAELNSTGENFSGVTWQTAGDGSFDNPQITNPVYFPGPTDIETGDVVLTETASPLSACDVFAFDNVNVIIAPTPTFNIPTELYFCNNQDILFDASASNYASILWATNGDGTFSNPNIEITQYFPGPTDIATEEFTISVCAEAVFPLSGNTCTEIMVETNQAPIVNAPGSKTQCDNAPVQLNSVAYNYSSILWTTQGDGTFENPEALTTRYYCGTQDKINGGTSVSVNAFGFGACEAYPSSKNTIINLNPSPVVDAGNQSALCSGSYLQLNASAENYAGISWSTTGDGFFTNTNSTNSVYIPGAMDYANSNFVLTLTAYPLAPCTASVTDELNISIVGEPSLEILTADNQSFPLGQFIELEINGDDYESILWETSGDGTFSDPQIENPSYTPGAVIDASGSPIILSATAFAATNCGSNVSDQISATFTIQASVYAGDDVVACEEMVTLSASSQFCESVLWETNGDGTFNNPGSLNPNYTPGQNDILNGSVVVCITGNYNGNQTPSDCLNISIVSNPIIDLGSDQIDACVNEMVQIELETASNFLSILWYTTNGGGDFEDNGGSSATYIPAPSVDYPQTCIHVFVLAQPLNPCSFVADDSFDICFYQTPEVDAGDDATITTEETFILTPTVSNASSVNWQSSGDGTFSDASILSPEYFPGTDDIANGNVELSIIAQPSASCPSPASDYVSITIHYAHSILIPEGWSGFSSYIGNNSDFASVMEPILGQLTTAQTMNGVYWPEGGINTIGNFSNATGYKIRLSESVVLSLTGPPSAIGIVELNEGWNLVPVLSSNYISYNDIAEQLGDKLIVMKEIAGNGIIWPQMSIYTIPVIKPGSAYLVAVSQNSSISFDEFNPMKSGFVVEDVETENTTPWNTPENTSITHTVVFKNTSLAKVSTGDYIAAFNENDLCVGLSQISNPNQNTALTIYGDENLTTNLDGMTSGEYINFKVYLSSSDEISSLEVTFDPEQLSSDGAFIENGLSAIEQVSFKSTSISEASINNISVYPNPCKGQLTFTAENATSNYTIVISDLNGRPVYESSFSNSITVDLNAQAKGFYIATINGDNYHKIEKLIIE